MTRHSAPFDAFAVVDDDGALALQPCLVPGRCDRDDMRAAQSQQLDCDAADSARGRADGNDLTWLGADRACGRVRGASCDVERAGRIPAEGGWLGDELGGGNDNVLGVA